MPETIKRFTPLFGRILLSALFLFSGVMKIIYWNDILQGLTAKHVPAAPFMLALAVFAEIAGGLAVLTGFMAQTASALLFLYMIPVTLLFHAFWSAPPAQHDGQIIQFLKNLALMGGLLILAANGPGPLSLRLRRTPPSPEARG